MKVRGVFDPACIAFVDELVEEYGQNEPSVA
jgi:hypothetical protein